MTTKIPLPNKEEFIKYYSNNTIKETAKYFNVSQSLIDKWCNFFEFKKRNLIIIPSEKEFSNYYKNHTVKESSKYFNVSMSTINKWRSFFNIKKNIIIDIPNKDKFISYYLKHTKNETAKYFNISYYRVIFLLKKYNFTKKRVKIELPNKKHFEEYFYNHTNDECAKYFNVSNSTISRWIFHFKLNKLILPPDKNEFIDFYLNHSQSQTMEEYNVSRSSISGWCKNFGLTEQKIHVFSSTISNVKLTESQENILIGTMLGDASLSYDGKHTNSHYSLTHCLQQYEYLQNIANFLYPFVKEKNTNINEEINSCYLFSKSCDIFTNLEHEWYLRDEFGNHIKKSVGDNGKEIRIKIVPKYFELNPEILAYWFFDDGTFDKIYKRITLYTNGFTEEEVNYLIFRLKNDLNFFNPRLLLHCQQPIIKFTNNDLYHFIDLVKPFNKFKCLQYKTDISNLKKSIKVANKCSYTDKRIKDHEKHYNKTGILYVNFCENRNKFKISCYINKIEIYFGEFKYKSMARKISNDIINLKKQGITDVYEYLKIKEKYKDLKNKK